MKKLPQKYVRLLGILLLCLIIFQAYRYVTKNGFAEDEPKIYLNEQEYVSSLEKINIEGTKDYVIITENVKWELPVAEEGTTVSFAIKIPYKFIIDGNEYSGSYILGDNSHTYEDNNPKYNLRVTDLTSDGRIKLLITKKGR